MGLSIGLTAWDRASGCRVMPMSPPRGLSRSAMSAMTTAMSSGSKALLNAVHTPMAPDVTANAATAIRHERYEYPHGPRAASIAPLVQVSTLAGAE